MTRKARAQSKNPWQQAERAGGVLTVVAVFFLASSVFLENASSADLPKEDRQPQSFSRASQNIHIHSPLLTGAPAAETLELQKEIDSFEKQSEEVEKATNPKLPPRDEQALREKATSSSLSVNRNSSKTVLWEEDRVEHFYVNQFTSITLILPKDEEVVKPREDVSMADLSSLAAFVNERRPNIVYLTPVLVDTTTSLVIFGKRRNYFILLTTTKNSAKASLVVRYKLPFSDEASFDALFDNAYPTATNANEKSTPKKSPQKKSKTGKEKTNKKKEKRQQNFVDTLVNVHEEKEKSQPDSVQHIPYDASNLVYDEYKVRSRSRKGKMLAPQLVAHDGVYTYLYFDSDVTKARPIVLQRTDNIDTPVNYFHKGKKNNVIEIHAVGNFTLRYGKTVICVEYKRRGS